MSTGIFLIGFVFGLFGMYLGYKMGYEEGHENGYELAKNRYMIVIEGYRMRLEDEDGQACDRKEHDEVHREAEDQPARPCQDAERHGWDDKQVVQG